MRIIVPKQSVSDSVYLVAAEDGLLLTKGSVTTASDFDSHLPAPPFIIFEQ